MMFSEQDIARFRTLPTPFFYYDLEKLKATLKALKLASGQHIIHYAIKANANDRILQCISEAGFGIDCVTGNEVKKAIETGFDAGGIAFAGVGKSDEEINYALERNIFSFNCESVQELEVIDALAAKQGKTARIALRINPDVNPNTHRYITTGLEENKFGINVWELEEVLPLLQRLTNLELTGLHFHIGSQITDMNVFKNLCTRVNEVQQWFFGKKIIVDHINVGGGLGVDYEKPDEAAPDFSAYFKVFNDFLELRPKQELHFEPGRAVVAGCGDLISKVLYIKEGVHTNFAILDAGMTELIRPALYQSYHKIEHISSIVNSQFSTVNSQSSIVNQKYDVVGPICESSDCFGKAVPLPETNRGDLLAIRTTGAYGEVMSSSYNLRSKAGVLYSDEG